VSFFVGQGGIRAEVSNGLAEQLSAVIEKLAPGARQALEDNARAVYDDARARWPVATGESRDGLYWGVQVAPDLSSVRGFVADEVPHAIYVKSYKNGLAGKSAMVELLRKPVAARAQRVADSVAVVFTKVVG